MSAEPWIALSVTLIGALILLVWRAAVTATKHDMRIAALEEAAHEIVELRKHVWTLDRRAEVRAARASAGQFDQGRTE